MTVCIVAMAEKGRAMVLCADRQRTAGEVRHEGRIAKKREIGFGWRFLYEDNGTRADELADLIIEDLAGERTTGMTDREMRSTVRQQFVALRDRSAGDGLLEDSKSLDLGILLVGFDENNEAAGYRFFAGGDYENIREVGYGVAGSGGDAAEATLAHFTIPMDDPLWHVLYKVYEAKRRADTLITSVGATTDMWIMTEHAKRQSIRGDSYLEYPAGPILVPKRIVDSLSEVFEWSSAAPWDRPKEPSYWQTPWWNTPQP